MPHRAGRGQRPGHLHRRPRSPPRPQESQPPFRRLQDPRVDRPRLRAHRRGGGHPANTPDRDAVEDLLAPSADDDDKPEILGDSAYADGDTRQRLGQAGYDIRAKVPPTRNSGGRFPKDRFGIDLTAGTVTCPANQTTPIAVSHKGGGKANFAPHCATCPLQVRCTTARKGRSITIHRHEALLAAARTEQATPEWKQAYRADRPIVERKIAHFVRRMWGGRKARCRGLARISTDVDTRAGALNLVRLATLGVCWSGGGWTMAGA
ncbi:MAG: transposase [Acidimicrobiales bacterium]